MIKTIEKPYRKTTANWTHVADGEQKTEQIAVEYYSLSVKELKALQAESKKMKAQQAESTETEKQTPAEPEATLWLSDVLLPRLRALPDLCDENEKPIERGNENLTLDWLESQDIRNLKNIQDAIEEDESPKSQNSASD